MGYRNFPLRAFSDTRTEIIYNLVGFWEDGLVHIAGIFTDHLKVVPTFEWVHERID
jgi:hypothetical protein